MSFVPALAVGAVTLAALGASWLAPRAPAAAAAAPARPSLQVAAVRVVKAPPVQAAPQPAVCSDCGGVARPAAL
jgi:hypothetical protein